MSKRLIKDVGFAIESQDLRSYLDKQTLEVTQLPESSYLDEGGEELLDEMQNDSDRYVYIEPIETRDAFNIMTTFAEVQPVGFFREQLFFALNSRHPFGRFKDVLNSNEDLRQQWFKFKDEWYEELAVKWLQENEINYEAEKD